MEKENRAELASGVREEAGRMTGSPAPSDAVSGGACGQVDAQAEGTRAPEGPARTDGDGAPAEARPGVEGLVQTLQEFAEAQPEEAAPFRGEDDLPAGGVVFGSERGDAAPGRFVAHPSPAPEDGEEDERHEFVTDECQNAADEAAFVHPADLADHLENLDLEAQVCALKRMSREDAAEALAELDENVAVDVLENLDADDAAQIIAEMEPDDAADVLDELDEDHRDELLGRLNKEDSEELRNLLNFPPDSAAGVMNTELILLEDAWSVDQAITHIRQEMELDKEIPYYGYVVDEEDKLVGVLSLRDLMLAKPGTILAQAVAGQSVVSVLYDTDKREVAGELAHYNFMALPVVDYENHLMGVVTYDDIMDIMHEEASADMLGMVGADPEETVDTPWLESVGKRLPWLCVNMINSTLSASVVYKFDGTIAQMAVLAVLMPMVANQGGNSGQQALAVMIRQLATDRFDVRKSWLAVLREAKIGLVTGFAMAILACMGAWFFTHNYKVGLVMGGALLFDMVLGAVAGGSIPLIFRALGRDPAQASSIFLTTITDGAGFFIFLGLATLFLF